VYGSGDEKIGKIDEVTFDSDPNLLRSVHLIAIGMLFLDHAL